MQQAAGFKAPQGQKGGGVDAIPCSIQQIFKEARGQDNMPYMNYEHEYWYL